MLVGAIGVTGSYEFRQESVIGDGEIALPGELGPGVTLALDTVAECMADGEELIDEV